MFRRFLFIMLLGLALPGFAAFPRPVSKSVSKNGRPLVVLFHGCHSGASRRDWQQLAQALTARGLEVATPELPGHGDAGGTPIEASGDNRAWMRAWRARGDTFVTAVVDSLKARHGGAPIVLVGAGCGGYFALLTAERHAVAALATLSGMSDEAQRAQLARARFALLGVASRNDGEVPERVAQIVAARAKEQAELRLYDGRAHGTAILREHPEAQSALVDWIVARSDAAQVGGAAAELPPEYPSTRRTTQTDLYHGTSITDPYRWLEALDAPEVKAWAAAQNKLAESFAGDRAEVEARILRYSRYVYANLHQEFGGRLFFQKGYAGSTFTSLYVRDRDGRERLLHGQDVRVDVPPDDQVKYARSFFPSPDGAKVVVLSASRGKNFGALLLLDASSGTVLKTIAPETHTGFTAVAWTPDSARFLYSQYDRTGERAAVRGRAILYALADGTSREILAPIADGANRHRIMTPHMASDSAHAFIEATRGTTATNQVYFIDLKTVDTKPRALFPEGERWLFVGARQNDAFFYTDKDAPRGRIVRLHQVDGAAAQSTIVHEGANAIAAGSQVGGDAYGMFGDRIVLLYRDPQAGPILRAFELSGRLVYEKRVSPSGSIWNGFTGDPSKPAFYYQFLGIGDAATVHRVDLEKGRETLISAPRPVPEGAFATERVLIESASGVKVPVLIAYRSGLDPTRPRKTVMYGYGAFGWNSFLFYQAWLSEWLLHHDGIFVTVGTRGAESWESPGQKPVGAEIARTPSTITWPPRAG